MPEKKNRMDNKETKRQRPTGGDKCYEANKGNRPMGLIALAALFALTACSGERAEEVPPQPVPAAVPISFSSSLADGTEVTRSTTPLEATAQTFHVYGYKNMSYGETAGYGDLQQVFPGYRVNWVANSANSSATNSDGWEYLGQQPAGQQEQTIKYWDWSARAYRFLAFAEVSATGTVTATAAPTACRLTFSADATTQSAIDDTPYYSRLWFSTGNAADYPDRPFGRPVKLVFMKPYAKVRYMFTFADPADEAIASLSQTSFRPTDLARTINRKSTVTVAYPLTGTDTREQWALSAIDQGAALTAFTVTGDFYYVLPAADQGTYTVAVSVNGTEQTAVVPAEFMNWEPGYEYTYIFKILDVSGGGIVLESVQASFTPWQVVGNMEHEVYNW